MRHSFGDDSNSSYEKLRSTQCALPAQCALRRQHCARAAGALDLRVSPSQTSGAGITTIKSHLPFTSLEASAYGENQTWPGQMWQSNNLKPDPKSSPFFVFVLEIWTNCFTHMNTITGMMGETSVWRQDCPGEQVHFSTVFTPPGPAAQLESLRLLCVT